MVAVRGDGDALEHATVREHAGYWVQIMNTGTQRKGLHIPGVDSSFEDPTTRCQRDNIPDGEPVAKELAVFPPSHAKGRVCDDCLDKYYRSLLHRGEL